MLERNPGCELDLGWVNKVHINTASVLSKAKDLASSVHIEGVYRAAWLLKAIKSIDLTTLSGDDTPGNVQRLCYKAARPIPKDLLKNLGFNYDDGDCPIATAAVCVYPSRVEDAVMVLKKMGLYDKINVASVATGFPTGQTPLEMRLGEIKFAVEKGAKEIDIVINRTLVLTGQWELLYQELQQMKEACGQAHMKSILAVGELGSYNTVYKASLVAMMAGSDFIKTSTGKETINATLGFGIVMGRAIRDYHDKMGYKVGLKPAGGIRTASDALEWFVLVKELLGDEWLNPELFRFGASGLLSDIEYNLYEYATGKKAKSYEFSI